MNKISNWFRKFFTSRTLKVIIIKFCIYTVIYFVILYFLFDIFWDESLFDVISK